MCSHIRATNWLRLTTAAIWKADFPSSSGMRKGGEQQVRGPQFSVGRVGPWPYELRRALFELLH
jgi:hypothetical protein